MGGGRVRASLVVGLLLAAGLAGCLGEDSGEDVDAGPSGNQSDEAEARDDEDATGEDAAEGNASVAVNQTRPSGIPAPQTLYFDEGPALASEQPAAGAVEFLSGPSAILVDRPVLVFEGAPIDEPVAVQAEALTVELWLEIDAPQPSTGEFDIVFWFGSTRGIHLATAQLIDAPLVVPGEPVHMTFEVPFNDARGFVVPAGESFVVHLAASQSGEEASLERLLVGEDTPSSVTVTTSRLAEDPTTGLADAAAETLTGTVPASVNPTDCRMQEGFSSVMHQIDVPVNAGALELSLAGEDRSPHHEDLDLHVHAEDGAIVLRTVSYDTVENMILAGPTLEGLRGSTLNAMVVACNDVAKDYTVDVRKV